MDNPHILTDEQMNQVEVEMEQIMADARSREISFEEYQSKRNRLLELLEMIENHVKAKKRAHLKVVINDSSN